MKPLCIFHGHCDDGVAAAWVVWHVLGADNVDFCAAQYQTEPPDVSGRNVLIVDFSYPRAVLERMAETAHSILIIDHHKTAAEDLAGIAEPPSWPAWQAAAWCGDLSARVRVAALFDMRRSGAGLTWDYLRGGAPRLPFINYIEDRSVAQEPAGYRFVHAGAAFLSAGLCRVG